MFNRIHCLLIKELAQIRGDRRLMSMLIIAPLFQLLILGFAASTDIREISMAVRDEDHTVQSREYIRALGSSGYFRLTQLTGPDGEDDKEVVYSRAGLVVVIPPRFGAAIINGMPVAVQVLADGADSNFGVQGLNYLQKATRQFAATAQLAVKGRVPPPAVRAESRIWYNPDLKSRPYMVPSIMALLLLVTTTLVMSMALVKEREEGTMEQLIVTPLRPMEIIIGKLLPFVLIGLAEITLILPLILLVFQIPLRGNLFTLYAMTCFYLLTTLGLGLFISTLVKTQQQAMLVATFFVMMPFTLLSGFAFPVENMPPLIQHVAAFIPLKYYLTIIRGLFLKGTGWAELWPQAAALLLWGLTVLLLAVKRFHKRMD